MTHAPTSPLDQAPLVLVDMNLAPAWVPLLASAGFAAIHWSEVGAANAEDSEILRWARDRQAVVFTNDLDFSALLALTVADGPSVVQIRAQDVTPAAIGELVTGVLRDLREELRLGVLVTIEPLATRIRVLPIRRGK